MADLKALAEQLVNLTVKEVNELADILKEEYGIEPAAAAVAVAAGGASEEVKDEQTEFDVILKEAGGQKLKDAKELVDSAPKALKEKVAKDEADALKKELEELGATVEIK